MKKLLMSSIIMFLFAASVTLVQVSCSKSNAGNAKITSGLGKIHYTIGNTYWIANQDGSNATQIIFSLPPNVTIVGPSINYSPSMLSPDGTKIFFMANDTSLPVQFGLYSADINGSNVVRVAEGDASNFIRLQGVY